RDASCCEVKSFRNHERRQGAGRSLRAVTTTSEAFTVLSERLTATCYPCGPSREFARSARFPRRRLSLTANRERSLCVRAFQQPLPELFRCGVVLQHLSALLCVIQFDASGSLLHPLQKEICGGPAPAAFPVTHLHRERRRGREPERLGVLRDRANQEPAAGLERQSAERAGAGELLNLHALFHFAVPDDFHIADWVARREFALEFNLHCF